jgi:hypothetical protein
MTAYGASRANPSQASQALEPISPSGLWRSDFSDVDVIPSKPNHRRPCARCWLQSGRTSIGPPAHSVHLSRQRSAGTSIDPDKPETSMMASRPRAGKQFVKFLWISQLTTNMANSRVTCVGEFVSNRAPPSNLSTATSEAQSKRQTEMMLSKVLSLAFGVLGTLALFKGSFAYEHIVASLALIAAGFVLQVAAQFAD